jgi:uncharacterized cupin superfamily protein
VANVFEPEWDVELPAPWRLRLARVGHHAGSERLGASVYEVEPGGVVSPLHTHFANEELVIALDGPVTLRTPDGERVLAPGEVVACPRGPEGAHQIRNRGEETARVLIVSEMNLPEVAEHLDSGKLVVIHGSGFDDFTVEAYRRDNRVEQMLDEPAE